MSDPADGAAEGEERERSSGGQFQSHRHRYECEVDCRLFAQDFLTGGGDVGEQLRDMLSEHVHERPRARIAIRIQTMTESVDRLATTQPLGKRAADVASTAELIEHPLDSRGHAAMFVAC